VTGLVNALRAAVFHQRGHGGAPRRWRQQTTSRHGLDVDARVDAKSLAWWPIKGRHEACFICGETTMRLCLITLFCLCLGGYTRSAAGQTSRPAEDHVDADSSGTREGTQDGHEASATDDGAATDVEGEAAADVGDEVPESAPAAPDLDSQAHRLFVAGREAYQDGRFEEAAALWERAFDLSGRATLLLGLGDAYDRLRRGRRAASVLRQYLVLEPDTDSREHLEARIQLLMRDGDAPSRRRRLTYIFAGVTGAAGLVSGLYWARARSRYDTLASTCGDTPAGCEGRQISGVRSAQRVSRTALGISVTAAITAVVTYFLEGRRVEEERAARRRARRRL